MNLRVLLALLVVAAGARDCWAWGATGHEWISGIVIEKLPDSVPAVGRTPEAGADIAVMGRELDRSKGAGKIPRCRARSWPLRGTRGQRRGHGRCPARQAPTREDYDTDLRKKGFTQNKAGYP